MHTPTFSTISTRPSPRCAARCSRWPARRATISNARPRPAGAQSELANAVIADDDEVDEHERHIDQLGMEILVRFHPMATDLRLVVSSMKISMNLERISDHATTIAKRAKKISASQELQDTTLIEPLYTLADHLLRDAISAYSDHNASSVPRSTSGTRSWTACTRRPRHFRAAHRAIQRPQPGLPAPDPGRPLAGAGRRSGGEHRRGRRLPRSRPRPPPRKRSRAWRRNWEVCRGIRSS
jgi:hypothetical protein